jgi:hypothetical protein
VHLVVSNSASVRLVSSTARGCAACSAASVSLAAQAAPTHAEVALSAAGGSACCCCWACWLGGVPLLLPSPVLLPMPASCSAVQGLPSCCCSDADDDADAASRPSALPLPSGRGRACAALLEAPAAANEDSERVQCPCPEGVNEGRGRDAASRCALLPTSSSHRQASTSVCTCIAQHPRGSTCLAAAFRQSRPHACTEWMRSHLQSSDGSVSPLQKRYAVLCCPQQLPPRILWTGAPAAAAATSPLDSASCRRLRGSQDAGQARHHLLVAAGALALVNLPEQCANVNLCSGGQGQGAAVAAARVHGGSASLRCETSTAANHPPASRKSSGCIAPVACRGSPPFDVLRLVAPARWSASGLPVQLTTAKGNAAGRGWSKRGTGRHVSASGLSHENPTPCAGWQFT